MASDTAAPSWRSDRYSTYGTDFTGNSPSLLPPPHLAHYGQPNDSSQCPALAWHLAHNPRYFPRLPPPHPPSDSPLDFAQRSRQSHHRSYGSTDFRDPFLHPRRPGDQADVAADVTLNGYIGDQSHHWADRANASWQDFTSPYPYLDPTPAVAPSQPENHESWHAPRSERAQRMSAPQNGFTHRSTRSQQGRSRNATSGARVSFVNDSFSPIQRTQPPSHGELIHSSATPSLFNYQPNTQPSLFGPPAPQSVTYHRHSLPGPATQSATNEARTSSASSLTPQPNAAVGMRPMFADTPTRSNPQGETRPRRRPQPPASGSRNAERDMAHLQRRTTSVQDGASAANERRRMLGLLEAHPHAQAQLLARARHFQALRGQMPTKRVASKGYLERLEKVSKDSLPDDETYCNICYNEFDVPNPEGETEHAIRLPKCKHIFGSLCIRKWLLESDSCPYCRDKLPSERQRPDIARLASMIRSVRAGLPTTDRATQATTLSSSAQQNLSPTTLAFEENLAEVMAGEGDDFSTSSASGSDVGAEQAPSFTPTLDDFAAATTAPGAPGPEFIDPGMMQRLHAPRFAPPRRQDASLTDMPQGPAASTNNAFPGQMSPVTTAFGDSAYFMSRQANEMAASLSNHVQLPPQLPPIPRHTMTAAERQAAGWSLEPSQDMLAELSRYVQHPPHPNGAHSQ